MKIYRIIFILVSILCVIGALLSLIGLNIVGAIVCLFCACLVITPVIIVDRLDVIVNRLEGLQIIEQRLQGIYYKLTQVKSSVEASAPKTPEQIQADEELQRFLGKR